MKAMIQVAVLALALTSVGASAHGKGGACKKIEKACKAGGHKKHKDMKACVDSVKNGGMVDGVTADQADIDACKAGKK